MYVEVHQSGSPVPYCSTHRTHGFEAIDLFGVCLQRAVGRCVAVAQVQAVVMLRRVAVVRQMVDKRASIR